MGFKREDIRDTSPLSLKKLNDTIRFIWLKLFGNIDFADLSQSTQGIINNKVSNGDFSSLIEQNPDSVKIAVGQVGTNNKIKNGNFAFYDVPEAAKSWSNWGTCDRYISTQFNQNYMQLWDDANRGMYKGIYQDIGGFKPDTDYTLAFTAFSREWSNIDFLIHQQGGGTNDPQLAGNFDLTDKPQRFAYTFKSADNIDKTNFRIMIGKIADENFNVFVTDVTFVEGAVDTGFSSNTSELKSTIVEINDEHLRATFSDGSYSEMNNQGFKWHKGATSKDYHYLSTAGYVSLPPYTGAGTGLRTATVQLPDEFKGKTFYVMLSVRSAATSDGYPKTIYGLGCEILSGGIDYANARVDVSGYAHFNADFNNTPLEISYLVLA